MTWIQRSSSVLTGRGLSPNRTSSAEPIVCDRFASRIVPVRPLAASTLNAATVITAIGIDVEIVDLRTLVPLDTDALLESAQKTGRVVILHEAARTCGFGAEIAATVAEELEVPVKRLGAPRIPVGYSRPLEDEARTTSARILAALN